MNKDEDDKKDMKAIAEKEVDEHEDDKHSAKGHKKEHKKIKTNKGGQWSLEKEGDDCSSMAAQINFSGNHDQCHDGDQSNGEAPNSTGSTAGG